MRIVFCGSGLFAVFSLKAIISAGHQVVSVVTQPARPRGRGGKISVTQVERFANEMDLPVFEAPDINQAISVESISSLEPDIICVVDFGQFIRQSVCKLAKLSTFNLHGSLLPELRGAAPINWAVMRGYGITGVTTFELVDKMDAGPVYLKKDMAIQPSETAEELRLRMAELGGLAVQETIELLASGDAKPIAQDDSKATLAPLLAKADGWIDWSGTAESCRCLIHGTWPWPGGHTLFSRADGKDISVGIARVEADQTPATTPPGAFDDELLIGTSSGRVRILQIKPAGGRLMDWKDFVNGYRVSPGDRFISPV